VNRRAGALAAVLAVMLAGCGPKVFGFGDSELGVSQTEVGHAFNSDYLFFADAKPGCGLIANPVCTNALDWPGEMQSEIASNGNPDVVVAEIGLNDAAWQTNATIQSDEVPAIRAFMSLVPANVHVVWANLPAMSDAHDPGFSDRIVLVNDALATVAAGNPMLSIADVHAAFGNHYPDWFGDDHFHFNATGRSVFARTLCMAVAAVPLIDHQPACDPGPST
jgi:hypothetical protein